MERRSVASVLHLVDRRTDDGKYILRSLTIAVPCNPGPNPGTHTEFQGAPSQSMMVPWPCPLSHLLQTESSCEWRWAPP